MTGLVFRLCKFSFLFRVIDLIFAPVCQDWFSRLCVSGLAFSTSGPEPFLDAVLIAEELVILLGIAR